MVQPIRMHHFSVRSFIIPCELAARRVLVLGRQATADKNSELSSSGREPLKCSGSIVRCTSKRYFISGRSKPGIMFIVEKYKTNNTHLCSRHIDYYLRIHKQYNRRLWPVRRNSFHFDDQ